MLRSGVRRSTQRAFPTPAPFRPAQDLRKIVRVSDRERGAARPRLDKQTLAMPTDVAARKGSRRMNLTYDIEIDVSGKEHRGKTTLIAYLSKILDSSGAELIVQHADPQIDDKLHMTMDQLREKLAGKRIFLREIHDQI
jgi:hypothetical protein